MTCLPGVRELTGECRRPGLPGIWPSEDAVRARLAEALGDAAVVAAAGDVGLDQRRAGAVVAIAASDRFPIPDPTLCHEHGGLDVDEMVVPFAVWRSR